MSAYHLSMIFGAPFQTSFAIFSALFVVLLLRFSTGPIEFEGLGLKFCGASGPWVIWIISFLAIIAGLYFMGVGGLRGLD